MVVNFMVMNAMESNPVRNHQLDKQKDLGPLCWSSNLPNLRKMQAQTWELPPFLDESFTYG